MNSHIASTSAEIPCRAFQLCASAPKAEWVISQAVSRCGDVIRDRQQSITVKHEPAGTVGKVDGDTLAALLARALRDMSSLSSRGAVLSLTAADSAIVIESHHPLEIPGDGLQIDLAIQQEARDLQVAAEMTWDQGRGPRITLMLPSNDPERLGEVRA